VVIVSYVSIITLSVNELNAPTKKQTGCADENLHMYALPLTTSLCLTPQIVCNYFIGRYFPSLVSCLEKFL